MLRRHRNVSLRLAFCALLTATVLAEGACYRPPNLSPVGQSDYQRLQLVKSVDAVRDFAISANAQNPPLLPEAATRKVVQLHQFVVVLIQNQPEGWPTLVKVSLEQTFKSLSAEHQQLLSPYFAFTSTLLSNIWGVR